LSQDAIHGQAFIKLVMNVVSPTENRKFLTLLSDEFRLHFMLQYGLYGLFFGCLLYIIFGSCKDVPTGPTAVLSLLTFQQVGECASNAHYSAILLCL